MHPAHEAFTDSALEPERIYAARERRARAEGVPEDVLDQYADTGEETDFALKPLPAFEELHSGMQVPSALGPWDVLETPGHSPSHLCLYQPQQRLMILGDLVSRVFAPWYDYGYTADPVAELAASLALVEGLDVELALRPRTPDRGPGRDHRHAPGGDRAAARARRGGGGARAGAGVRDRAARLRPLPDDDGRGRRLQEAMACLRHLRLEGRVVRDVLPSGVFRYRLADDTSGQ